MYIVNGNILKSQMKIYDNFTLRAGSAELGSSARPMKGSRCSFLLLSRQPLLLLSIVAGKKALAIHVLDHFLSRENSLLKYVFFSSAGSSSALELSYLCFSSSVVEEESSRQSMGPFCALFYSRKWLLSCSQPL